MKEMPKTEDPKDLEAKKDFDASLDAAVDSPEAIEEANNLSGLETVDSPEHQNAEEADLEAVDSPDDACDTLEEVNSPDQEVKEDSLEAVSSPEQSDELSKGAADSDDLLLLDPCHDIELIYD